MGTNIWIGGIAIAAAILTCMFLSVAISRAVFPMRKKMFEVASSIAYGETRNAVERAKAEMVMNKAMRFDSGWIVLRALFEAIREAAQERIDGQIAPPSAQAESFSPEMRGVVSRFMVSALVANPVAMTVFIPSFFLFLFLDQKMPRVALQDAGAHVRPTNQGRRQLA